MVSKYGKIIQIMFQVSRALSRVAMPDTVGAIHSGPGCLVGFQAFLFSGVEDVCRELREVQEGRRGC